MKWIKILFFISLIALGTFLFVYGEKDDSPGCQFLGLLVVMVGGYLLWKKRKSIFK